MPLLAPVRRMTFSIDWGAECVYVGNAKLRHLSWKRNFVLALFDEDAFCLVCAQAKFERNARRHEPEKRISEKGDVSRKNMYKTPSSRARVMRARPVFLRFCVHPFTFGLYFAEI